MITTALFDFDGVVADTEPLYDLFWEQLAKEYQLGIPDFHLRVKGMSLGRIFETFFADSPKSVMDEITRRGEAYELEMPFQEVAGAGRLLRTLKEKGFRLGLVTGSCRGTIDKGIEAFGLEGVFDVMVTAECVTQGKPDPMCYRLAAEQLGARPEECVVFEDSFLGIQAGESAGMRVVGLSTTNSEEELREKVFGVIPDFRDTVGVLRLMQASNSDEFE